MRCLNCLHERKLPYLPPYVIVNGVGVDNCLFADENTGIALVYAIDEKDPTKLKVLPDGRNEVYVLRGDVKIVEGVFAPMGKSRYDMPCS